MQERFDAEHLPFRILFEHASHPYLIFDAGGIVDCNDAAVKTLGCSDRSQLLAAHPAIFSPETQPDGRSSGEKSVEMDRMARENGYHRFEWMHKKVTGEVFPVEVTLSPVCTDTGTALLVAWRDLTEEKAKTAALDLARQKNVESAKMATLGEMAAGLAHEINNPLAVIVGYASQILHQMKTGKIDNDAIAEKLRKIEATGKHAANIVRSFKTFSRNASGDPMQEASLSSIISDTMTICRDRFRSNAVALTSAFSGDAIVKCRPSQISQVLTNLLGNAFDAVSGTKGAWVVVDVCPALDGTVALTVTDSGLGLPEAVVAKLTQPFFTTKPTGLGTGLGLSISRGIAEEHGGRLFYDRTSPNTRFVLCLPTVNAPMRALA